MFTGLDSSHRGGIRHPPYKEKGAVHSRMEDYNPQYALYQEQVERQIPVFLLTREAGQ